MRAVGTPNKELDLDAALGISWGGASRCDAADPTCVTDGGTGEFATAQPVPQPAGRIGGVATLRISIAGNDEGLLRVGLYSETPVASETFALLAQGAYKDTTESTPAGVDGTRAKSDGANGRPEGSSDTCHSVEPSAPTASHAAATKRTSTIVQDGSVGK